jgi:hypothetical protein
MPHLDGYHVRRVGVRQVGGRSMGQDLRQGAPGGDGGRAPLPQVSLWRRKLMGVNSVPGNEWANTWSYGGRRTPQFKMRLFWDAALDQEMSMKSRNQLHDQIGGPHDGKQGMCVFEPFADIQAGDNIESYEEKLDTGADHAGQGVAAVEITAAGQHQGAQPRFEPGFKGQFAGGAGFTAVGQQGVAVWTQGGAMLIFAGLSVADGQAYQDFLKLARFRGAHVGEMLAASILIDHLKGSSVQFNPLAIRIEDLGQRTPMDAVEACGNMDDALVGEDEDGPLEKEEEGTGERLFKDADRGVSGREKEQLFPIVHEVAQKCHTGDQLALALLHAFFIVAAGIGEDQLAIDGKSENGQWLGADIVVFDLLVVNFWGNGFFA